MQVLTKKTGNMKQCTERRIKVGLKKNPKVIFDKVEEISAKMIRKGWKLNDSCIDDGLGYIYLFFERDFKP